MQVHKPEEVPSNINKDVDRNGAFTLARRVSLRNYFNLWQIPRKYIEVEVSNFIKGFPAKLRGQ